MLPQVIQVPLQFMDAQKVKNAKIFILFPHKKVSEIQRKQMTTNKNKNVFCYSSEGKF